MSNSVIAFLDSSVSSTPSDKLVDVAERGDPIDEAQVIAATRWRRWRQWRRRWCVISEHCGCVVITLNLYCFDCMFYKEIAVCKSSKYLAPINSNSNSISKVVIQLVYCCCCCKEEDFFGWLLCVLQVICNLLYSCARLLLSPQISSSICCPWLLLHVFCQKSGWDRNRRDFQSQEAACDSVKICWPYW